MPPRRCGSGGAELARYASDPLASMGRRHPEPDAPTRSAFQRDRDRIVHSTAFRRLVYKTQVFLNHEGDLFRTRLTHSLEVAQLGRSIARSLRLCEDLVEAIALAHDLGHTPFGHAGQDALHACMKGAGGFEHNLQSLRVVDRLEERYAAFDGLNLCLETREGILKHCSMRDARALESQEPSGVAARFILKERPSLEAQLCNLADEIAYNAHDIDDGVRSGLISLEQVCQVPLFARHVREVLAVHPTLTGRRLLYEAIRRMLSAQVYDVIDATQAALKQGAPVSARDARRLPAMVCFSASMRRDSTQLKRFLFRALYRHARVMETTGLARQVVNELFEAYVNAPKEMQAGFASRPDRLRAVADYVSGMTDRFAIREHERLTGMRLWGLYAVSCGTQQSQFGPTAATHPPALPASGKGASRPLPSGFPAKKAMADNPLASVGRLAAASRPSPTGGLRPALTQPPAVATQADHPRTPRSLSTRNDEGPLWDGVQPPSIAGAGG